MRTPTLLTLNRLSPSLPSSAVVEEGQSEQLPAQCVQPEERSRAGLPAPLVAGRPAQRELRPPGPVPAAAGPARAGQPRRRPLPKETRPLQNLGPVQEHV